MAQMVAKILFTKYFLAKYGPESKVLTELEYLSLRFTASPLVNKLLDAMTSDFANAWTAKSLRGMVDKLKIGRPRKPDVMGISPIRLPDGFTIELVEVSTEGQAKDTIKTDITPKLQVLNEKVIPIFAATLQEEMQQSLMGVKVLASSWRPGPGELVWPFLPALATPKTIDWLCLRPTFRNNPPDGSDGLILYEYHSVGMPQAVPKEVIERLRQRLRGAGQLQLLPTLAGHWQQNPADAEAMRLLALGVGVGALVIVAVLLLPEEVIVGAAIGVGTAVARAAAAATAAAAMFPQALERARVVLDSLNVGFAH
jgi:hypothetical protein